MKFGSCLRLSRGEALGLVVLILSSLVMWQNYDVTVFRNWFYGAVELGITKLYLYSELLGWEYRVVYPPLAPAMFVASYAASLLVYEGLSKAFAAFKALSGALEACGGLVLRAVVKLPLLAASLALWALTRRRLGRAAATLILVGPPVLVVVATYNFDLVMVVLVLLSTLMIYRARYALAGALLAMATMFKQSAVLALLPEAIYVLRVGGVRPLISFACSFLLVSAASIAPFVLSSPPEAVVRSIAGFHASRLPQGPSLWSLTLILTGYDVAFASRASALWIPAFASLYAAALAALWRALNRSRGGALEAALVCAFTAYLATGKVINPAYLVWAYPFVVYVAFRHGLRRVLTAYIVLSLVSPTWYSLLYLASVASGAPLFIEEEVKWYPATYVEKTIIEGSLVKPLAHVLLQVVRMEPIKVLLTSTYEYWPLVATLLALLHALLAAYSYTSALTLLARTSRAG